MQPATKRPGRSMPSIPQIILFDGDPPLPSPSTLPIQIFKMKDVRHEETKDGRLPTVNRFNAESRLRVVRSTTPETQVSVRIGAAPSQVESSLTTHSLPRRPRLLDAGASTEPFRPCFGDMSPPDRKCVSSPGIDPRRLPSRSNLIKRKESIFQPRFSSIQDIRGLLGDAISSDLITDIHIDHDASKGWGPRLARGLALETIGWMVILLNFVCIWVETVFLSHSNSRSEDIHIEPWIWLQYVHLTMFFCELSFKIWYLRTSFFSDVYNVIDLIIFCLSAVPWFICFYATSLRVAPQVTAAWRKLCMLRIIRVLRVVQLVRHIPFFRELWFLIRGMTMSLRTLMWGLTMTLLLIYTFAVFATTMIGFAPDFENDAVVQERFGSVSTSIVYLFQIMTLDDWMEVVEPILEKQPWLWMFFFAFISISVFALLNLMTAVIVESALQISRNDEIEQDDRKREQCRRLRKIFLQLHGSSVMTREEFLKLADNKSIRQILRANECDTEDVCTIFEILQEQEGASDSISIEHFIMGLQRMKGAAKSRDLLHAANRLDAVEKSQREISSQLDIISRTLCRKYGRCSSNSIGRSRSSLSNLDTDDTPTLSPLRRSSSSVRLPAFSADSSPACERSGTLPP